MTVWLYQITGLQASGQRGGRVASGQNGGVGQETKGKGEVIRPPLTDAMGFLRNRTL